MLLKPKNTFGIQPDLQLDAGLEARWWQAFVLQNYVGADRFAPMRQRAEDEILALSKKATKQPVRHVETIKSGISPEDFQARYFDTDTPVLIKGFYKDTPAVKKWTPQFFKEKYGHENVPSRINATTTTDYRSADLTMAQLVDDMLSDGEFHGTGFEAVLNNNPELRDDLHVPRLEPYAVPPSRRGGLLHPVMGRVFSTQMFMAAPRATTGWHCAAPTNLFAMIYGKKHWYLVHPSYTPWMHTVIRNDTFYFLSLLDHRKTDEQVAAEGYRLYPYVPKYEAIVDAGDMLFVPSWWWHAVDNYGPTIACAPRAVGEPFRNNPLFSLMSTLNRAQWEALFMIVLRKSWPDDRFIGKTMRGWGLPERVAVPERKKGSNGRPAAQPQADAE
jgi:Cupin-like domain